MDNEGCLVIFFTLFLFGLGVFLGYDMCDNIYKSKHIIPAIEVYRGNTDLLITYNDSIPIDSVVIYKKK